MYEDRLMEYIGGTGRSYAFYRIGHYAFSQAGPFSWNQLPANVRLKSDDQLGFFSFTTNLLLEYKMLQRMLNFMLARLVL